MKFFVDGNEIELESTSAEIAKLSDRLVVKTPEGAHTAVAIRQGEAVLISYRGQQFKIERKRPRSGVHGAAASGELRAPMPGQIVDVLAEEGATLAKGDKILVLEAMKTQQPFTAPFAGTLVRVNVKKGEQVVDGALLALVQPSE
jgi:3-methylcrotonyl-CoA carboxylase alpha subunit